MPRNTSVPIACSRSLRHFSRVASPANSTTRSFSKLSHLRAPLQQPQDASRDGNELLSQKQPAQDGNKEEGAMSRRLSEATESAILEGGRAGRKAVEEAGFSEELKAKLLEKVAQQSFQSEYAEAFAEAGLSSAAGQGTRDVASAQPWRGEEATQDTILRMLDDAHKPLKPGLRRSNKIVPPVVDMRIRKGPRYTPGQKISNARESASLYASTKDATIPETEKEAYRKELKERFAPAARAMPNTMVGLAALANERIEDAIARGQFKNIPRGKGVERDARADNPFIDTTEYIMNKMIQRQDLVPPWIEKQQELVKEANIFRGRLRYDWKRHAARSIASRGGTLEEQVKLAELYSQSEQANNPRKRAVDQISVPTTMTDHPVMTKVTQQLNQLDEAELSTKEGLAGAERLLKDAVRDVIEAEAIAINAAAESAALEKVEVEEAQIEKAPQQIALPTPFRDPVWEKAELSYLTLAIKSLNTLTRSYNLMAPELAKKPYFSLDRELAMCYADIAPQLPQTIRDRAMRPPRKASEAVGPKPGGILDRMGGGTQKVPVHDETRPAYGFKEFWRDLWTKDA